MNADKNNAKPRRVKARITRTVTEIAIVSLNTDGGVEEIEDIHDEIDSCDEYVLSIHSVLSVHP